MALATIVIIVVALFAFNTASTFLLRSFRLDLTEDRLYSLSPGITQIIDTLDEPVRLDFYWSQTAGDSAPQVRSYAQRVRELLEELVLSSHGMLVLSVIDPEPFSAAEDAAQSAGLAKISVDGAGATLTLGLVVRGSTDKQETIPFLAPQSEPFLEYEIARAILTVGRATRPKVALLSSLPTESQFDPSTMREPQPGPVVFEQMRQLATVESVGLTADELPASAEALVLVHPRALSEKMMRSIDAFALSGKPIILFFDPWCESDPSATRESIGGTRPGTTSELGPLLTSWGFGIDTEFVVGDRTYATRVQTPSPSGGVRALDYPVWLSINDTALAKDDPMTGGLKSLNIMSVGSITPVEGAKTKVQPAVESSRDSMLIQTLKVGFFGDPEQLIRDFKPDDTRRTLAARVTGPIASAFPADDGTRASGTLQLFVVADADLLSDPTWVTEERAGNTSLGMRAIADNGPFVYNAVEIMTGTSALAGLRGRGAYSRSFERVSELQHAAEARYIVRERELQDEIRKTEMRIAQLQRERTDASAVIMTAEQESELAKAQVAMTAARKELRQVQFDLRKDVKSLGTRLMVANVILWPVMVAAIAMLYSVVRARRGRQPS
ncbi:MAG: Gldg family protein [Planctomycetota bacterium]|nr:Gldg family protein [Planctomycetota bacterium]